MNIIVDCNELGLELEVTAQVDRDEFGYGIEGLTVLLNHPTKVIKYGEDKEIPLTLDVTSFLNKRQIALIKEQLMNEFDNQEEFRLEQSKEIEK
jgi:hypothetical protein